MKIFDLSEQISAVGYTFNTLEVQEQYILFPVSIYIYIYIEQIICIKSIVCIQMD